MDAEQRELLSLIHISQAAKGMGAAKVMITDISDLRLAKAKECGIDVCVNTKNKDFGEAMIEMCIRDRFYGAGENQVKAVNQVDIQIEQGEFVAIVGKSGPGKSTLLHMLGAVSYTHLDVYKRQSHIRLHRK